MRKFHFLVLCYWFVIQEIQTRNVTTIWILKGDLGVGTKIKIEADRM